MQASRVKARFAPAPSIDKPHAWGVWDRVRRCWAEPPNYCDEAAERFAAIMSEAHASGSAEATARAEHRGLPFGMSVSRRGREESWGVWDNRQDRWAERPLYDQEWAERITNLFNETYAAGLAEAMIEKARRGPPASP